MSSAGGAGGGPGRSGLRVAVIGCGSIARRAHIPGLMAAGAEITVLSSATTASAEAAAADVAIAGGSQAQVVVDWEAAVAHPDVDAVTVCTPNHLHEAIAVAAARAGKHVLVEKPMAVSVAAADAMIAAAQESGVVLLTAHNVRFAPPFLAAASLVRGGRLGMVTGVRAAFGHGGPEGWAPQSGWFRDRAAAGGGALADLGVHVIDLIRAVTGAELDVVGSTMAGAPGDEGVEDDSHVLFRLVRSERPSTTGVAAAPLREGAAGTLHASWIARPAPDHQLTVFGTDGTLHLDSRTALTFAPNDESPAVRVDIPPAGEASGPFHEFVSACTGGSTTLSAHDGRAAVAVVEAAYRLAR